MDTHLEDEDGVAVTALRLATALDAAVVDEHATVEGLAGSDGLDSVEGRAARGSRKAAAGLGSAQSSRSSGGGSSAAGAVTGPAVEAGVGAEREGKECELSVLHFDELGNAGKIDQESKDECKWIRATCRLLRDRLNERMRLK